MSLPEQGGIQYIAEIPFQGVGGISAHKVEYGPVPEQKCRNGKDQIAGSLQEGNAHPRHEKSQGNALQYTKNTKVGNIGPVKREPVKQYAYQENEGSSF